MNILYRVILVVSVLSSTQSIAKESMVYGGSYDADIKNIKSANTVNINIDVWAGYARNFDIKLANIDVPEAYDEAPDCHLKLIKDSLKFTKSFIRNAKELKVQKIAMEDSSKNYGSAEIHNEKTKLSKELLKKGFARSNNIPKETPWCQDEE